jgi:hypothetical protein
MAFVLPVSALAQLVITPPSSQTLTAAGSSATYVFTLTNSSGSAQTFVPTVTSGITNAWAVQLPASIPLANGASQSFNLVLTPPVNLANASYPFTVTASNGGGVTYSANGALVLAVPGPPVTPAPSSMILLGTGLAFAGLFAARRRIQAYVRT